MRLSFSLIIFLCFSKLVIAQDQTLIRYSNTITKEDLKKHLSIIASDEYLGRETGEKGQEMAAKYIENEFAGDLLNKVVDSSKNAYYQEFELTKNAWSKVIYTSGKVNR